MDNNDMKKQVATDLGITELPEDQQDQLIAQFGEVALKAATIAVLEKLDEGKRAEFATLAEGGDAQKVQEFLDAQVPNHEELAKAAVQKEVENFRAYQESQQK
jgi:hypothetical protein